MTDPSATTRTPSGRAHPDDPARERIYRVLTLVIQLVLVAGVIGFVLLRDWPNALLTVLVIALTALPRLLGRVRVNVPPEFQLIGPPSSCLARLFWEPACVFSASSAGWGTALHTASGCAS